MCSCELVENKNHILWECVKYNTARISLVEKFNKLRIKTPIDFREILKRMKPKEIEIIISLTNAS